MRANKLVVELFSLAILSGSLVACSKNASNSKPLNNVNMKINTTKSNSKSNIFTDDDYNAMVLMKKS